VNGDERNVWRQFQIMVLHYLYITERRAWWHIKDCMHTSVILSIAGSKGLLVSHPDLRHVIVSDQFEDVQIILWRSGQVCAKNNKVEKDPADVYHRVLIPGSRPT
jgi:hypothetical protein